MRKTHWLAQLIGVLEIAGLCVGAAALVMVLLFWPAGVAGGAAWLQAGHIGPFAEACLYFNGVWLLGIIGIGAARSLPQGRTVQSHSSKTGSLNRKRCAHGGRKRRGSRIGWPVPRPSIPRWLTKRRRPVAKSRKTRQKRRRS